MYGARKVTHLSTLVEVNETIEIAKHVLNVVGDSRSQESDVEDVADSIEEIFQSAGELEVEEDFESGEESETSTVN